LTFPHELVGPEILSDPWSLAHASTRYSPSPIARGRRGSAGELRQPLGGVFGGIEQAYGLSYLGNAATPSTNGRLPLP
jgi:hypothetical protein